MSKEIHDLLNLGPVSAGWLEAVDTRWDYLPRELRDDLARRAANQS